MIRFYTLPPRSIEYPFLLVNIRNWKELRKRRFKHAILDSGVEIFKSNPNLKDYPKSVLWRYSQKAEIVSRLYPGKVWVTIPDYPDDLNPGQFGDNIEKTLRNIEEFISIDGVEWLPVIQSRYLDIFSFYESCQKLRDLIGDYPRIAIGTVCKTRKLSFIEKCCSIARKFFPNSWIHAFGLTLRALPKVKDYIDSFDSLVPGDCGGGRKIWWWKYGVIPYGYFDKINKQNRPYIKIKFFYSYLKRLTQIVELEGFEETLLEVAPKNA